jgi:GNAT superfamily N-acetyltransferase
VSGALVRDLRDDERGWLRQHLELAWGSATIVSRDRDRDREHDAAALPALVAVRGEELAGLATYRVCGAECELVTLEAFAAREGVGSALLAAVAQRARDGGASRLWLVTTNDNLDALRFYQRRGLRLVAVHPGAVDRARRRKPAIPLVGAHGIEAHDEVELELALSAP